jgi:hypothetical protein
MKNIIDGADNAVYSVFQATEEEFKAIFPKPNQDLTFSEDICRTKKEEPKFIAIMNAIWERPILKKNAMGIHGTILYNAEHRKSYYPKSRRMIDMNPEAFNWHERDMNAVECKRLDES